MFVTYMGRISVDKGFYRFLSSALSLIDDSKYSDLKFRIVAPSKDIEILSEDLKSFLKEKTTSHLIQRNGTIPMVMDSGIIRTERIRMVALKNLEIQRLDV